MFTLRRLLQGSFIVIFIYGLWPPESMLMIGGGIVGFVLATLIPGLDE